MDPSAETRVESGATEADIDYLRGDHAAAAGRYRRQIESAPDVIEHWAGLALALRGTGDSGAARVLCTRPEVVLAVHQGLRNAHADGDLEELACWLDGSRPTGSLAIAGRREAP